LFWNGLCPYVWVGPPVLPKVLEYQKVWKEKAFGLEEKKRLKLKECK